MPKWTPFLAYRDFHDVPRLFLVRCGDKCLFFECSFDDGTDDYGDKYAVFVMPDLDRDVRFGSWADLSCRAVAHPGDVPIASVRFDETRRRMVDLDLIDGLG